MFIYSLAYLHLKKQVIWSSTKFLKAVFNAAICVSWNVYFAWT